MLVEVIGVKRDIDFTDKKGNRINGTNIYVEHPENGVEGLLAEKYFLNYKTFSPTETSKIKSGDMVILDFNRFGKVVSFSLQDKK